MGIQRKGTRRDRHKRSRNARKHLWEEVALRIRMKWKSKVEEKNVRKNNEYNLIFIIKSMSDK